ncbi:MAG: NAD(P)H-hydrate dehydratase [Candidatus Micrarchaeota archaeon]|nr:NAD(P)H-hydrate dehydratase [Candidatus Micrarchaeota archaeon]
MRLRLPAPKKESHKGQNGIVLVIGGSRTYHGAPILAVLAAIRFCDLVYFYSLPENQDVLRKMKISTANVICINKRQLGWAIKKADCILIGNGMDVSRATKRMVDRVLAEKKKCVLDAAAIKVASKERLHRLAILTPHAKEFQEAFGKKASSWQAAKISAEYGCTILLKGRQDTIAHQGKYVLVKGGNPGMTKGGTGDVLAGLLAAIYANCENPFEAAYTASYLNKKTAEQLHATFGCYFSSEDLAAELAFVAAKMHKCA